MYKVISNGQVIDLIETVKYLRYLPKSKRITVTDKSSANCIQGSDNVSVYGLQGINFPSDFEHKIVILKKVDKDEFQLLQQLLKEKVDINADDPFLIQQKAKKIEELKEECDKEIISGICIELADSKYHTFELTIEDQLNLRAIQSNIMNYKNGIIYHEKGQPCKLYTAEDMQTIIDESFRHIQYHTTYFNLMKQCINNMTTIMDINSIHYGDEVPDKDYQKLLSYI